MSVEVLFFADLKEITGKDKEKITLKNFTLLELMNFLFRKYNSIKNLIWDEKTNSLKKQINIVINDKILNSNSKLSISLQDGDKVAFLLPFSGG